MRPEAQASRPGSVRMARKAKNSSRKDHGAADPRRERTRRSVRPDTDGRGHGRETPHADAAVPGLGQAIRRKRLTRGRQRSASRTPFQSVVGDVLVPLTESQ